MQLIGKLGGKDVYYNSAFSISEAQKQATMLRPYFSCTVFFHQSNWGKQDLQRFIGHLLKHGCVYLAFHGDGCEAAHDLADELSLKMAGEKLPSEDTAVLTTWHEDESEEDVIAHSLRSAWPAAAYEKQFSSRLFVTIGRTTENDNIRSLLLEELKEAAGRIR
jgi:hypothetical protein